MKNIFEMLSKYELRRQSRFSLHYFVFWLYEIQSGKLLFHNSGYLPSSLKDENASKLQLYLELMSAGEVRQTEALNVCDVGCGQGHGAVFLLHNYLNQNSQMTGLETSRVAISYCKWKYRKLKNLRFKLSCDDLPCVTSAFDVFLSVGSGVENSRKLLQEIYRCLKPSGLFLFFGSYATIRVRELDKHISSTGFAIVKKTNVTSNVIQSLRHDEGNVDNIVAKLLWFLPNRAVNFLKSKERVRMLEALDKFQNNLHGSFIYAVRKMPEVT